MTATDLIGAEYWANFWEWIADKAFILVVAFLAIEYITGRWAKPHREELDDARKLEIAQLTKDAARLSTEGDQARAAIAGANARAAQAEQKAAEADVARLRLEAKLAPRSLDAKQQKVVSDKLNKFAGTRIDLIVLSQGSTPDTASFSVTLEQVFKSADWKPLEWTAMGGSAIVTGILVTIREGSEPAIADAASAIVSALNVEGIDAGRWEKLDFKTGKLDEVPAPGVNGPPWNEAEVAPIRILIGTKP